MNPVTFKSRENEIGHAVEQVTRRSCKTAMSEERNAAIKKGIKADEQGCIDIPCSYDMGWQKRGKGHNSSTGHAAVMGLTYGKVMDYTTRTKSCRVCTNAKKTGKEAKQHNCRVNHTASSKAMEPMAAVHLFTESLNSNVKLSVYVGDEDSTTAAHIKEKVPYPVEKWTDIVHAKRSLTTRLYNLSQRGKFVNSSTLSQKVINYLVKCFAYSVSQNKGNPSALQKSLKCILPHSFGNHENCNESWCGAKKDPINYKHSDLPYGKDLYGDDLRKALERIFDEYCTDIVVAKLSPGSNSQRNEALNSVIGSKNPKIRYYGGSQSNDFRVACGISQVNLGYQYISQTLESLNIEPGIHCIRYIERMDHKATQDKLRKNSINFKRQRAQLHKQKLNLDGKKQAKEGNTYQSGIGLNLDPNNSTKLIQEFDIINMKISSQELKNFETCIPELMIRAVAEKFSYDRNNAYNFVIYDIETNTTGKTAEICQLSAVDKSGLHSFNDYILPLRDVDIHATRVNGLSVRTVGGVRTLFKDNQPVETVSLGKSLENFLTYLEKTVRRVKSDNDIYTVLIGHNSQVFDNPTLLRQGGHQLCEKLSCLNVFFSDTLPVMKNLVKRKHPSLVLSDGSTVKLNQQSVYQTLFHEPFPAHDAMEDVKALRRIVFDSRLNISEDMLTENMSTTQYAENDMKYLDRRYELLQTFRGTLYHPTNAEFPIKQQIAEKIAGSGISYQDLKNVFKKFGAKGLVGVLSLPPSSATSKAPRVTKTTRILAKIVEHFKAVEETTS